MNNTSTSLLAKLPTLGLMVSLMSLAACGGGGGPAVKAMPQSIAVDAGTTSVNLGETVSLRASASSRLDVRYTSQTPLVCSVSSTGVVTPLKAGACVIAVKQAGNPDYAPAATVQVTLAVTVDPAQRITFNAPPVLSLGGSTTVQAVASSGLPVVYSSLTPNVCNVQAASGVVVNLMAGDCIVAANQPGDSFYQAAAQVTSTLNVSVPSGMTVPAAPAGVVAELGEASQTVVVNVASVDSGGSPIARYTIRSSPARVLLDVTTLPATVSCGGSCSGLTFAVSAHNLVGEGAVSSAAQIVTAYEVEQIFLEPETQPRNSIFRGSFVFNATTGQVSALQGQLTESMTGNPTSSSPDYGMTLLDLRYQLSSIPDSAQGGLLVTTFLLNTTNTLSTLGGGDGWSPGTGGALYYGWPKASNPSLGGVGNAYARIFLNTENPTAPLTQAQIDKLAYADCTVGGMMGAACMTGTTVAGYGSLGSMSGYPVSQVIRKAE